MNEGCSRVLDALKGCPLAFEPVRTEQSSQGGEILVFSCRELPRREFVYVPGRKGMTLGWDTERCPVSREIQAAFHQYYQESLDYYRARYEDERDYYQRLIAQNPSEEKRRENEVYLREAEEALQAALSQPWNEYWKLLLADLDACTSPLRTVDIAPMLAERQSWYTGETIEPPFSLPTEDEWEYLCCGGVHTLFPWGDTLDLHEITEETVDKEAENSFGLFIGLDRWSEQAADTNWLKGNGGGDALSAGDGARASFGYIPYFRYGLYYPDPPPDYYRCHYRRVLRLAGGWA